MSSMILTAILDNVLNETGFKPSNQYAGSNDSDYRQLVAMANRSLRVLAQEDWQELHRVGTILPVDGQTLYDLPDDFRYYIPDSAFYQETRNYITLPAENEYIAYLRSDPRTLSTTYQQGRFIGGQVEIFQTVGGEPLYFDYISNDPVTGVDDVPKPRFTADDDTTLLDDDLIMMDIIWRWSKVKELKSWNSERSDFLDYRDKYRAGSKGARKVNLGGGGPRDWQSPWSSPQADQGRPLFDW